MRLGAILVPLNYRLAAPELRAIVDHAGAMMVIADDELAPVASQLGVSHESRAALSEALDRRGGGDAVSLADTTAGTAALLVYTSGTTGRSKGALHTHGGLFANATASIAMHRIQQSD